MTTLNDHNSYTYYMEGAKNGAGYTVVPLNVTEIADGLKSICTFYYWVNDGRSKGHKCFAIGKVKET